MRAIFGSMNEPLNPFPIYGYFGPAYFCNREKETDAIIASLKNGRNITLYAPRRIGKTGLIHHVFHHLGKKWNCVYLDVQESFSFKDFTNSLLEATLNAVSKNKTLLKQFQDWLLMLRPVMSANPHSGSLQLEVDFASENQQRTTVKEALKLLDSFGPGVIALDEFQQINSWDVDSVSIEGWIRSEMQQLKNLRFIFSGSQYHLLSEMFNSAKRPFYASTQAASIGKIPTEDYSAFIRNLFKNYNRKISSNEVNQILNWADGNTYNVQLLCNRVFSKTKKEATQELIDSSILEIYAENKLSYMALSTSMSKYQWQVLTAIALEGKVYQATSKEFITHHKLGSSSSVLRALEFLTSRELVYQYLEDNGRAYYEIYDIILMRWLQKK
ncbi:MAG: Archaeal ATPase [Bacteroidetes bacterium OLB12]|nr:MAG: Archaeal ATPase [Bacteroidetes bacterium OLB12]